MFCAEHGQVMDIGAPAEPICSLCLFTDLHLHPVPENVVLPVDDRDGISPMPGAE
jgi:hypothetical protein